MMAQQENPCGTPDRDPAEYKDMLQWVEENRPSVASAATYDMPIWLYFVRDDQGDSNHDNNFAPQELVNQINTYFQNTAYPINLQFYLCGLTYLNSTEWTNLDFYQGEIVPLATYAKNNNPQYDAGFISVFLVSTIYDSPTHTTTGVANPPYTGGLPVVAFSSLFSPGVLAHELGHYFSLQHTFTGGPSDQYVDEAYCKTTGDNLCSTPADPGNVYCSPFQCTTVSCTILDPLGMTYHPDPNLLMSYYNNCYPSAKFTDEQYEIMVTLYLYDGYYEFLRDATLPTCQDLPSDKGFVYRKCSNSVSPMGGVHMKLLDPSNQACGFSNFGTDAQGRYNTYHCIYPSYTGYLSILPKKNYGNMLNGVTPFDLSLINSHIINKKPFGSPFQVIAADADNNGYISTADIIAIRKVILEIEGAFPAGSWRYVPELCLQDQDFANEFNDDDDPNAPGLQLNPFNAVWTDPQNNVRHYQGSSNLPNNNSWMDHVALDPYASYASTEKAWTFWGAKVGDVDCSAEIADQNPYPPEEETFQSETHALIAAGDTVYLVVWADSTIGDTPVAAWQLGLEVDFSALEIQNVQSDDFPGFDSDFYHYKEEEGRGELRALWYDTLDFSPGISDKNLLVIRARALQSISDISQNFQLNGAILPKILFDTTGVAITDIPLHLRISRDRTHPRAGQCPLFEGVRLLTAFPVPFKNRLVFQFTASETGNVKLSLFDPVGSQICMLTATCAPGNNLLRFDQLDALPGGLYHYLIQWPVGFASGNLVKL